MSKTLNLFTEICSLQNELNSFLDPDWKKKDHNFRLAASQELAELIDHLPWKWWKSSELVDIDQARLEVVDITHFIIADMLKYFEKPELVARLILDTKLIHDQAQVDKGLKKAVSDVEETYFAGFAALDAYEKPRYPLLVAETFKLQARLINCSAIYLPDVLIELWDLYELSIGDIAKIFFSKNTLNLFRYKHGYREGTYVKQWGNQETDTRTTFNLYEDNVILHQITSNELAHCDWTDPTTRIKLYELLEQEYQRALLGFIA